MGAWSDTRHGGVPTRRFVVVIDLDGTLVDSAAVCARIVNHMLSERNADRRVRADDARRWISHGGQAMVRALLGPAAGDPEGDLAAFRDAYAQVPTPPESLYPGVRETLEALSQRGFVLAVCSNKPQQLCEKVLGDLGLEGFFDTVVGSAAGRPAKPHVAPLDLALAQAGGARTYCCHVGDSLYDQQVAEGAGAPFIFAAYGYPEAGLAPRAAAVAQAFPQVVAVAERLRAQADLGPAIAEAAGR